MASAWKPVRRENPSGKVVWVARWKDKNGKVRVGYSPDIPGTYQKRGLCKEAGPTCCAVHAIEACMARDKVGPALPKTVGTYAASWARLHPRSRNTDLTNESRVRSVLGVELDGVPLKDWPFETLRRRHANMLADHMLRVQGKAYTGVNAVLGILSAMVEDAIEDEAAVQNPFRGMKRIRPNDPRIQKSRRAVRVLEWREMHDLAAACARVESGGQELVTWRQVYAEPMIRLLSDCGLRIGEVFPLHVTDLDREQGLLRVRRSLSLNEVLDGTKTTRGQVNAERVVPVPPALLAMLKRMILAGPPHDSPWLFPAPRGGMWQYAPWRRAVWNPGRELAGFEVRPHELRHSWVSLMRAALIDVADLADAAGHSPETQSKTYTHALNRSFEAMKEAVGE